MRLIWQGKKSGGPCGRGDELTDSISCEAGHRKAGCTLSFSCHLLNEFCPGCLVNVRENNGAGGEKVGCIACEGRGAMQGECEGSAEASIPGTEPGTCLSAAFTSKLLCRFC